MRKRLLSAGFFALRIALSAVLAGCGSQASSGSAKSTALFDPDVPRSDAPEAIDAELANRFIQTKNASDKMFSEEDGRTVITHKYGRRSRNSLQRGPSGRAKGGRRACAPITTR